MGETLRRNHLRKFIWENDSDVSGFFPVLKDPESGITIYPVHKVYKRLVNGSEDNIISFYDIIQMSV